MRTMTEAEQIKVLDALKHHAFWAEFQKFDCICYGGRYHEWGELNRYFKTVIVAFPEDVLDDHEKAKRKAKADQLRAQADQIEAELAGKPVSTFPDHARS